MVLCDGSEVFVVKPNWHIVCMVLNFVLPGFGTMLSAFGCLRLSAYKNKHFSGGTFCDGMMQFYLAPLIFGWIWSILYGLAIYRRTKDFGELIAAAQQAPTGQPAPQPSL